jgi:hypothetical protein
VLSLVGETPHRELDALRQAFPEAPVTVELHWDDPAMAFAMLRSGAYNVISSRPIFRAEELWRLVTRSVSGNQPYPALVQENQRPQPAWGFMSMTFDVRSLDHSDYELAIRPTMRHLGLGLHRIDEIPYNGFPMGRERIVNEINNRPVLVALVTTLTLNTMDEITVARQGRKTVLPLRRYQRAEDLPEHLKGMFYVEYASMTELAMKLFVGLGGPIDDLRANGKAADGGGAADGRRASPPGR